MLSASEHRWGVGTGMFMASYRHVCVHREKWSWGRRESTVCTFMTSLPEKVKLVYKHSDTVMNRQGCKRYVQ